MKYFFWQKSAPRIISARCGLPKAYDYFVTLSMQKQPARFWFYLVILLIFLILKCVGSLVKVDELHFLIRPVAVLVSVATGSASVYITGEGYWLPEQGMMIDKSCAGINFYILCLTMLLFVAVKNINSNLHLLIALVLLPLLAFIMTWLVNTARILSVASTGMLFRDNLSESSGAILHEAVGVVVVLMSLVLTYVAADHLTKKYYRDEKDQ
jgi:exosortase K